MEGISGNPISGGSPIVPKSSSQPSAINKKHLHEGFEVTKEMKKTEGAELGPKDAKGLIISGLGLTASAQAWKGEGNIGDTYQNASQATERLFNKEGT